MSNVLNPTVNNAGKYPLPTSCEFVYSHDGRYLMGWVVIVGHSRFPTRNFYYMMEEPECGPSTVSDAFAEEWVRQSFAKHYGLPIDI